MTCPECGADLGLSAVESRQGCCPNCGADAGTERLESLVHGPGRADPEYLEVPGAGLGGRLGRRGAGRRRLLRKPVFNYWFCEGHGILALATGRFVHSQVRRQEPVQVLGQVLHDEAGI